MKTKEELEELKEEYTGLNKKLAELTEGELQQVTGGAAGPNVYGMTDPETGTNQNAKNRKSVNVNEVLT